MAGVLFLLLTARLVATPQWQSSCQIAATPLVGQQIQRPAPSAALAAATCEADRVLHVAYVRSWSSLHCL